MKPSYETLVGTIYDCAVNPALWTDTLSHIRDAVDAAYVAIGSAHFSPLAKGQPATWIRRNSPWDENWLDRLTPLLFKMPHGENLYNLPVDVAWTQLTQMPEAEFQKSEFYHAWVRPQNLRDCLSLNYLKRHELNGVLSIPTSAKREPISNSERELAELLSPHIRRAMTINDLTENNVLTSSVYKQVLDTLSVAVFIVGPGQRIQFTNALGDTMLSKASSVFSVGGVLKAHRPSGDHACLEVAIGMALAGGCSGQGVPLLTMSGEIAAAYVMPLAGSASFAPGHCAVFVTRRGTCNAMALDVLRAMFNLTVAEARVALHIAAGEGTQRIAVAQGIAMNTVRTHLKHIYSKMDVSDQTTLAGLVNSLLPPVT